MSTIRLHAIPLPGLPQRSVAEGSSLSSPARIQCVLHSGPLPAHQHLEVRINGILQTGTPEGTQTVFAWQLFKATDEVAIVLWHRAMRMRQWQGCWNERDAILHTGTLHIHILFDGQLQPLIETTTTVSSPAVPADAVNGTNGYTGTDTLEKGEETQDVTMIVHDLLIIAEAKRIVPPSQETEQLHVAEDQNVSETEVDDEDEWNGSATDDEDEAEADEHWSDDPEMQEHQQEVIAPIESSEETPVELVPQATLLEDKQPESGEPLLRTGSCIAAFHASPVAREETLQALKELVATLPSKTVIVDLRVQRQRQKKKEQEHDGLSKQLLRAVFGTAYWDRGWAIQTADEHVAPAQSKPTRGRLVVVNPDHHPDGIPALVQQMREGYSIVVMDTHATYEESRRQAVIEEVRKRIADLDVGPLS